jgi:hypothetical protein
MHVITKAAKQAVDVCQKTFVDRRWNCSTILFAPNLKSDLVKGKKRSSTARMAQLDYCSRFMLLGGKSYDEKFLSPSEVSDEIKKRCQTNF